MATTELSLMATPGKPHTFSPKGAAAAEVDGTVCFAFSIRPTVNGSMSVRGSVNGEASTRGTVAGSVTIAEC